MSARHQLTDAARQLARSRPARAARERLRSLVPARGDSAVRCPICGATARGFLPFGRGNTNVPRPNAQCRACGSLERHRLVWLYLNNETDLFTGTARRRLLHLAPEPVLEQRFKDAPLIDYLSADLDPDVAAVQMDVMDIAYPADTFDVIYCSHVLEHVPDDRRAMRELCRVLRPGGWAILQVPILVARTEEDPSVTDPAERLRRFAQPDHVRVYGPDYADRLRSAGFSVAAVRYADRLGPEATRRYGLQKEDVVHFCTKN